MSDLFSTFDSNGGFGEDPQHDLHMASPSQSSPMTNNNTGSQTNISTATQNGSGTGSSGSANAASSGGVKNGGDNVPIVTKPRLLELVREVDTAAQLDEDVEELLLQIVDDFVDDCVKSTGAFALHRKANRIEVRDVQLHLERKYNMWIPGFGTDELRPYKRAAVTEAHKQRLALIKKTIKKY